MKEPTDLTIEIQNILKEKNTIKNNEIFDEYKDPDIAEALQNFDNLELELDIFKTLNHENQSKLFAYLDSELQEYIINGFKTSELSNLVNNIYSDDLIDIIDDLPTPDVEKILNSTTVEKRRELNDILQYGEQSAGGIMTVNFVKLNQNFSVEQAVEKIRNVHEKFENVDDLFIVDDYGTLVGELKLKELLFNEPKQLLKDVMDTSFVFTEINTDQEEVGKMFKRYDINTLAVIDQDNRLAGIITVDDIVDVFERETTEDIQKFAGITPLDSNEPFKQSVWKMVLSRSVWLAVGLVLATIVQIIIVVFLKNYGLNGREGLKKFDQAPFAMIFLMLPMAIVIASVCGISINQTTSNMVRVLQIKNYDRGQLTSVILKEFLTSFIISLAIIAINVIRLIIFYEAQFGEIKDNSLWYVVASSSIAIFVGMLFGSLIGSFLPLIIRKLKWDPALVSSPLTTGIIDIISISVFFGIGLAFF